MTAPELAPSAATAAENEKAAAKKRRLVAMAIQLVVTAIAFAVLKRTPDARLRGPRWLWQMIVPVTVTKATEGALVVAPVGPILFFLFGKRRKS